MRFSWVRAMFLRHQSLSEGLAIKRCSINICEREKGGEGGRKKDLPKVTQVVAELDLPHRPIWRHAGH